MEERIEPPSGYPMGAGEQINGHVTGEGDLRAGMSAESG